MTKKLSRVEQQAREAKAQAAELEKKIRHLSTQIAQPQKYLVAKPDMRTRSTLERFRTYFKLDGATEVPTRKPTRGELRIRRNRTLAYILIALVFVAYVIGRFLHTFLR